MPRSLKLILKSSGVTLFWSLDADGGCDSDDPFLPALVLVVAVAFSAEVGVDDVEKRPDLVVKPLLHPYLRLYLLGVWNWVLMRQGEGTCGLGRILRVSVASGAPPLTVFVRTEAALEEKLAIIKN